MRIICLSGDKGPNGGPYANGGRPTPNKGGTGRRNGPRRANPARERDRLLSILSLLPDAIMVLEDGMKINYMNARALELFGDNVGRECHDGLKKPKRVCRRCPVTLSFGDGKSRHADTQIRLWGGYARYLETDVIPLSGFNGNMKEVVLVARDVTSPKALECRRRDTLSMISHDLKTQLNILAFNAELFPQSKPPMEGFMHDDPFEALKRAARNTSLLMDDFLTLSRIECGRLDIDPQPIQLSMLLSYTLSTLRQLSEGSSANIETAIPDDLPEVMVDMDRFGRIITNIITNALKYGQSGVNIRIEATAEDDGEMVRLEITDDGPGIPARDLPYIFDRYYDGSRKGKAAGHGLGLAIVKKITEMHGGDVQIKSIEGEGTTIVIRLPSAPSAL